MNGTTEHKLIEPVTTSESDNKQKSELSEGLGNPAGRGGADSEMAATILYLAGPGGLFCNGEVIHPDVSRPYIQQTWPELTII